MTRPLLLAAGLLFAGCHSSTPARMPAPSPTTDTAPAAPLHHPPRADLTGPAAIPLAELVATGRPCTEPLTDPFPSRPEHVPLDHPSRPILFVTTGPARCANQPRRVR